MKQIITIVLFVLPLVGWGQVDSASGTPPIIVEVADTIDDVPEMAYPDTPPPSVGSISREHKDSSWVLDFAEQQPEFHGGVDSMFKFIRENLNYPDSAIKKSAQGTIKVSFIVEKDGRLTNVETIGRVFDKECADEAVRVVKLMPPWIPGKQNGKLVRVKFVVPIKFKLK